MRGLLCVAHWDDFLDLWISGSLDLERRFEWRSRDEMNHDTFIETTYRSEILYCSQAGKCNDGSTNRQILGVNRIEIWQDKQTRPS